MPKNGIYLDTEEVKIEFFDQTEKGKTLEEIDEISTVTNLTSTIGLLSGTIMSFNPLAPFGIALATSSSILGAPGAIYSTGRSISRLVDRGKHD